MPFLASRAQHSHLATIPVEPAFGTACVRQRACGTSGVGQLRRWRRYRNSLACWYEASRRRFCIAGVQLLTPSRIV